ncbi:MAG: thermopsin, partial [Candidatus Thermoplasmatota archaeon]|nr:thermopsin [Candidatus Thermoplasmatota archaeon]
MSNSRVLIRIMMRKRKALTATAVSILIAIVILSSSLSVPGTIQSNQNEKSPNTLSGYKNLETKASSIESGFFGSSASPIGIADAGVSANGSYSYSSSSFLGKINIYQLKVSGSQGKNLSFQLNLNLKFFYAGNTYVYWVQDVAFFNTSDNNIYFIDNVWNFSTSFGSMSSSSVSGNGSIISSSEGALYYDIANASLPGNFVNLTEPAEIELMSNSTLTSGGSPEVVLRYNDGSGWVTYDNVIFKFAKGNVRDSNFVVNGQMNDPKGYSYDAELIMGGPGGGSSTTDILSNVTMRLQFWNGHNFQEITNAINYGLDTGETISNALSEAYYYNNNGTIYEKIVNGTETTGVVYYSSNISILKVSSPFNKGIIMINGTPHDYIGGQVNLTLGPGNYSVRIINDSLMKYSFNIDLRPGEDVHLYEGEYPVIFNETGLVNGEKWWVNTDGSNLSSTSGQIITHVPNGTYSYIPGPDNSVVKTTGG